MNPDNSLPSLDLTDQTLAPTIDIPALDTTPLNASSVADVNGNANVSPVANNNGSGGFDINSVLNTLASTFNGGVGVYNNIAKTLGTPQIGATKTTPTPAPVVVAGLTQTQWYLVGGGVAFIGLLFLFKRR